MDTFTQEVWGVCKRYAQSVLRSEELIAIALVLAWWEWKNATEEQKTLPPSVWARVGVRHALEGRDLPGLKRNRGRSVDPLDVAWRCGAMAYVADRSPGPERIAQAKEEWTVFLASLNAKQTAMAVAIMDGITSTGALAAHLGVSEGRVSQIRREMATVAKQS